MLSSTNTIVGVQLGLGCHDRWGCLLPWLGDCLSGWWGCAFWEALDAGSPFLFGGGLVWGAFLGCVLLLSSGGDLFGCGGGCFWVLGHLEIQGSSSKTKLLKKSFKVISHRKFSSYFALAYISIFEVNILFSWKSAYSKLFNVQTNSVQG